MALAIPIAAGPDPSAFREALSRFATGVAFVTAVHDGEPLGLIVNSFSSVSLDPPLISICPSRSSFTWARMRHERRFAVNILATEHRPFVTRAAPSDADRFGGIDWIPGRNGAPLLANALATLECNIVGEHPAGDHWIVVGEVESLSSGSIADPLVFFAGTFHAITARAA